MVATYFSLGQKSLGRTAAQC